MEYSTNTGARLVSFGQMSMSFLLIDILTTGMSPEGRIVFKEAIIVFCKLQLVLWHSCSCPVT